MTRLPNYTQNGQIYLKRSTKIIYLTALIAVGACIASMPLINIFVSVSSPAIIRPATEINTIRSNVNGRIRVINIVENQKVKKGEALFIISDEVSDEKTKIYQAKVKELELIIADLEALTSSRQLPPQLQTSLYTQDFFEL